VFINFDTLLLIIQIILYCIVNKSVKKFGKKDMNREIRFVFSLLFLFGVLVLAIVFGSQLSNLDLDVRDQAAGKTHFVENSQNLQDAINKASNSDAIFLKVGSYTTTNPGGFVIKNKNIRILGAGKDFVNVLGNNNSYVFTVENSSVKFENIKISGANKDGVLITNTNVQSPVEFYSVEIANNSGAAINSNIQTVVSSSLLDSNGIGVKSTGDIISRSNVIKNSASHGIHVPATSTGNITVENTIFSNNNGTAIMLEGGKTHSISNITANGNSAGIVETGTTSTTKITNSIVQNSKKEGISIQSKSTATYSNAFGNKSGDFTPAALKTNQTNLSVESQFVSENDFHLAAASPLKDKGDVAVKDENGSRVDMGAFGGKPRLSASNAAPTISSTPPRFVKPGEAYNYEVKATDPDNDELTYTVLNTTPGWIRQDKNKFTGTPTNNDVGFAGVVLVVSDKKGHNIVHPISINIIPANRNSGEKPVTTSTPAPSATPTPVQNNPVVPKISIVSPKSTTKFSGDTAEIQWTVNDNADVNNFVIKYTDDKETYKTLTTLPGKIVHTHGI
jgi:hypothetical protein